MSTPLEDVVDAIQEQLLPSAPGPIDSVRLASRFDAEPALVADCVRGLRALQFALDEDQEPAGADELAPPTLPDDYEVRDELGRGGMGVVYRAWQKSLQRELAVKVLRPGELMFGASMQRFRREAQRLANLRHPHIVSVHEVGEADGHVYFTMDLVDGGTMRDLLARRRMNVTQSVRLMLQVCEAISYAHGQGVVHRDLKPANILIAEKHEGQLDAFVVDFGLARDLNAAGGYTLTGQVIGTPGYMSPEQALGQTDRIGERSDVYALGVLLYECLTRKAPFADRALVHTLKAIVDEEPPAPHTLNKNVPRELSAIVMKAMAKKPMQRFFTVEAMVKELRRFAAGEPTQTPQPSVLHAIPNYVRRHRRRLLLMAPLLLAAIWWFSITSATRSALLAQGNQLFEAGEYHAALSCYDAATDRTENPPSDLLTCVRYACCINIETGRCAREGLPDPYGPYLGEAFAAQLVQPWVPLASEIDERGRIPIPDDLTLPREPTLADRAVVEWVRGQSLLMHGMVPTEAGSDAWLWPDEQAARDANLMMFCLCDPAPLRRQHPVHAQHLLLAAFEIVANDRRHANLEFRVAELGPYTVSNAQFEQTLVDYLRHDNPRLRKQASIALQKLTHVPMPQFGDPPHKKHERAQQQAYARRLERLWAMDPVERRREHLHILDNGQTWRGHYGRFYLSATGRRLDEGEPIPEHGDPRQWLLDAMRWDIEPRQLTPARVLSRWRKQRESGVKDIEGKGARYASLLQMLVPRAVDRPVAANFERWAAAVDSLQDG